MFRGCFAGYVAYRFPKELTKITGEDSPGTPLFQEMPQREDRQFDKVDVKESFRTHLMFKSSAKGSIWVSIARLDWFWNATASFSDDSKWILSDKDWKRNPVAEKLYELPEWKNNRKKIMKN